MSKSLSPADISRCKASYSSMSKRKYKYKSSIGQLSHVVDRTDLASITIVFVTFYVKSPTLFIYLYTKYNGFKTHKLRTIWSIASELANNIKLVFRGRWTRTMLSKPHFLWLLFIIFFISTNGTMSGLSWPSGKYHHEYSQLFQWAVVRCFMMNQHHFQGKQWRLFLWSSKVIWSNKKRIRNSDFSSQTRNLMVYYDGQNKNQQNL